MTDIPTSVVPPDRRATPEPPLITLDRSLAQAVGLAAENAALIQQQDHAAAQATLQASVARLLGTQGDT